MRRLGLLLVIFALLFPLPARAQEEIDCDAEELRPWLENYLAWSNVGGEMLLSGPGEDLAPFLLVLHDLQTQMDGPGRPACADALMLETYRTFHAFEQALLCLRTGVILQCTERMQAADEAEDLDDLIAPYIAAAGISDDERANLRPPGWDADNYRTSLGLAAGESSGAAEVNEASATESTKGTRSTPYLSGEWAVSSEGRIRVMPVHDNYQAGYGVPPQGHRFIAVPLEYECYQEDENQSCSGSVLEAYVAPDGIVYGHASVFDSPYIEAMEGYSGAVLRGNLYFSVPVSSELGQLRLVLDREDVFFELTAAE